MTDQPSQRRAAVLVDYQNLHHYLKGRLNGGTAPGEAAVETLQALRERLAADGVRVAEGRAYADWGGLDEPQRHVQRALYVHGVQPVYVPATAHRNTTDLQLAVDALGLTAARPDLDTFVLVSGDRDYVPVVQALAAAGRRVLLVAFKEGLGAHLVGLTQAGETLDAEGLLSAGLRAESPAPNAALEERGVFNEAQDVPHDAAMDALVVLLEHFGQYEEVYLTPLLRKLTEELGEVEGHDAKSLVADLEGCGCVRLERRKGMPFDYTVLLVNRAHPAVEEAQDEVDGEYDDEDEAGEDAYEAGDGAAPARPA